MRDRGVTPVVGKGLEILVVLGYIALVAGVMYGGVVPAAREAGGAARGDQVLAAAATGVDAAVPATGRNVSARHRVSLPDTIAGRRYTIRWRDGGLVLEHPAPEIGGHIPVSLPDRVVAVRGTWNGSGSAVVTVVSTRAGLIVTLTEAPG